MGRNEDRTILVELGVLRPFSDVAGRHVIRIDESFRWRQELAQRLRLAGCPVSLDGTEWHSAGDFKAALNSSQPQAQSSRTQTPVSENERFSEILNASRLIRGRISPLLSPGNQGNTAIDGENIVIALCALAGQMNALGMNELNERLEQQGDIKEKLNGISQMLGYLEVLILNRKFEDAKREFASLVIPSHSREPRRGRDG